MSQQSPEYLTTEMIRSLELEARSPVWQMGVLAAGYKNWQSVFRVSPAGLIHFYGNKDTGWGHVISRHGFYSNDLYFGEGAKGSPSKLPAGGAPVFSWVQIADEVFIKGEIDTKHHQDSELFVKYTGQSSAYKGSGGKPADFALILYRGTRIVHSIYPKKHLQEGVPKTKLKDYKRGLDNIVAEKQMAGDRLTIRMPYLNERGIERFVIVIHADLRTMHSRAHIQVNGLTGHPWFSVYNRHIFTLPVERHDVETGSLEFIRFFNTFTRFGNFGQIEAAMLGIEKQLNENEYPF